ncbi:MAG: hypothetical protein GXP30_02230 [Verrucomicrobia bacterium]|nr:hypothetical protein [Verrucomicrobiota bacterium]
MRILFFLTFILVACTSNLQAADAEIVTIPGTAPLIWLETGGELSDRLMDGAHVFVDRQMAEAKGKRAKFWNYDFSSPQAYQKSIAANRERFKKMIGLVDQRVTPVTMERFGDDENPALLAETDTFSIHQVRWPVLDGVFSEGLLVAPTKGSKNFIIVIPDADQTPEQLIGLAEGDSSQAAAILDAVGKGSSVLIPTLINRSIYLGPDGKDSRLKRSDQSHREWIYRQAFHMGRHIIGYEVQKILAAIDWAESVYPGAEVAVEGFGEGSLIAFYAAACDQRIDEARIHGYFGSREKISSEPIYRNVYGLLREFGDAEIASLIAPRKLNIISGNNPDVKDQKGDMPAFDLPAVHAEIKSLPAEIRKSVNLVSEPSALRNEIKLKDGRKTFSAVARHDRLFHQLETHVQSLVRHSNPVREGFYLYKAEPKLHFGKWSTDKEHPTLDPANFIKTSNEMRRRFEQEAMGKFDEKILPLNARTRKILETDKWTAYDVVLDVYPELQAWGTLVMPKGIKKDERRPVVVCQHGRNGLPRDSIDGNKTAYNDFSAKLAERGFITFAAHNLYRGEDRYRWLDRKANSVGASLFSFIIPSHRQILKWLATQPQVDAERIAFYGLSYGGESAVRIPSVIEEYCLSICSGDFNQWTRKVAATDFPNSFMTSIEWEMPYWNLGHTFDYAEMTYLIFPRPFMVERGHHDRVSVDRWVAHEYGKVRWLYAQFGKADLTEIEYFQGGHSINGKGTFDFLHKHLKWPKPQGN